MKKTITNILIASIAVCISTNITGQVTRPSDRISKAIAKVEYINVLNEVNSKNEAYKTTSTDRVIKRGVYYFGYYSGSSFQENFDSVVYTNEPGRYSELSKFEFEYTATLPEDEYFYAEENSVFAANTAVRYRADGNLVYSLNDSSSYTYNSNGDVASIYSKYYNSGDYSIVNYTYDATNKLATFDVKIYQASGALKGSDNALFRYGSNYFVMDYGGGSIDSAILDANGRTIALYSDYYLDEFTYDANGYLASYIVYDAGILEFSSTLSYETNYKQYSYEFDDYTNGYFTDRLKRILIGQSGVLDSVYYEAYDSAGNFLGIGGITDVTVDSYGNVISTEEYDDMGNMIEAYRYYYEDVVTGLSDIRRSFSDFKVYPNPGTQSDIMISTGENFSSVTVSSISGQKILHTSFRPRNEMRLDVSNLSAGSYLISVRSDDGRESSQVFTKM